MWRTAILLLCILLSACQLDTSFPIRVSLNASSTINSLNKTSGLPVELVLYQLSDINQFREASFDTLWEHDEKHLNSDLISKQSIVLSPNEIKEIKLTQDKRTKYLAVVAFFRKPKGVRWRVYRKTPGLIENLMHPLFIKVKNNQIEIG